MKQPTVRTTLTLPAELLENIDLAVRRGQAKSRKDFVTQALRHKLAALRKTEIDAAFATMADDAEYRAEALQIEAELATASWEALQLGEKQP